MKAEPDIAASAEPEQGPSQTVPVLAVLGGVVRITPPYTRESCLGENEIVLQRTQAFLDELWKEQNIES